MRKNEIQSKPQVATLPPLSLIIAAVFLWSTGGLFIKFTALDAPAVNLGRSFFAALTVAAFTYRKGLRLDTFTLLTALLYAGTLICFVYANKTTTAANAIFLQYTAPIYILILSPLILREKFRAQDLLTVVICLAGMSLFFLEPQAAYQQATNSNLRGNLAGLASGAFFGAYFVCLKHPRALQKNPALSVFYGNLIIVLLMLPLVWRGRSSLSVGVSDILAILFLGVLQIGIAYLLFTTGVARGVRALDASIIGFIEPLLNPIWVFLFLGEHPGKWALVGGAIILTAVATHSFRQTRCARLQRVETTATYHALD